jgi:hypothetical protein
MSMARKLGTEFFGTVLAAAFPGLGIGFLGVALRSGKPERSVDLLPATAAIEVGRGHEHL